MAYDPLVRSETERPEKAAMPPKPATSDLEWPAWLAAELEANALSGVVGSELVSESDRVRVWSLKLQPGERIGFIATFSTISGLS